MTSNSNPTFVLTSDTGDDWNSISTGSSAVNSRATSRSSSPALKESNGKDNSRPRIVPKFEKLDQIGSVSQKNNQEVTQGIRRRRSDNYTSESSRTNVPGPGRLPRTATTGLVSQEKKKAPIEKSVDLRTQITKRMKEIGCLVPTCLPDDELAKLMKIEDVQNSLQKQIDGTVMDMNFVKRNPKVLAITLLVHKDKKEVTRAMIRFHKYGFTDDNLSTIKDMSSEAVCTIELGKYENLEDSEHEPCDCGHDEEWDAFHFKPWCETSFEDFLEKRWKFLIPKFEEEQFVYEFDVKTILPFKKVDASTVGIGLANGNFGEVTPVLMLARHQTAIKTVSSLISTCGKVVR